MGVLLFWMQRERQFSMSYPAVKKKFSEIVLKLGLDITENKNEKDGEVPTLSFLTIDPEDSSVIVKIKEKLNSTSDRAKIRLLQGDLCEIWFHPNGKGLVSPKIHHRQIS